MSQLGALYLADNGYTWEKILRYYYLNIDIKEHPYPCAWLNETRVEGEDVHAVSPRPALGGCFYHSQRKSWASCLVDV